MVGPVFVDTSALITLLDRADPRHEAARTTFVELADRELVTHGYVVAETLAVAGVGEPLALATSGWIMKMTEASTMSEP